MYNYYHFKALYSDGDLEIIFSSYILSEVQYEMEAEEDTLLEDGYTNLHVTCELTKTPPCKEIYPGLEGAV